MAKRRLKVKFRIPPYVTPRTAWRGQIHSAAAAAIEAADVEIGSDDPLDLDILIYLSDARIQMHDVDNRLKDIMDALQGRVGGPKKRGPLLQPLIWNDSQVFRVRVEKQIATWQSGGLGHVTIRGYHKKQSRSVRSR